MRLRDADLHRQARTAERVLARGAGAPVEARQRDDVGSRLGDADRDDADVRHDRDLDRNARARIHGLELVDDLGEIFDRVDVVVVRRRDEVDARLRVARQRDLLRDLARRQVTALAGLGALPDLDLEIVRRVREQGRHAEPARRDLLTAIARIAADQIGKLPALAVDAEQVDPRHRLGVRAVRRLALRSEGHRRDVEGSGVLPGGGIGRTVRIVERAAEVDEMPQRDRVHSLELAEPLGVRRVRRFAVGDRERRLPCARPDPEGGLEPRVASLTEH